MLKIKNLLNLAVAVMLSFLSTGAEAACTISGGVISANCSGTTSWTSGNITVNSGVIVSDYIYNFGNSVGVFTNNGTVFGSTDGIYNNNGTIDEIINFGTIGTTSSNTDAIYNVSSSSIGSITNAGTLLGGNPHYGAIFNVIGNTIGTFNNLQGAGNPSGPVIYNGILPSSYNIIIRSPSEFGRLESGSWAPISGNTTFGIYAGGVTGVAASTVSVGTYSSVLSGVNAGNLNNTSGTYGGLNWVLINSSGSIWDLVFSVAGPSSADTQSSLHSLASKLRSGFSGQAIATNFANMNTYDCNLFDSRGLCISVGGQQTYVDNPSSNLTSTVVVAGYKVSPTLRIGGFLNQNLNNHTSANVDISNANPLMGLFAVWNQNEDHLGYQVKVANAYQDKDVRTIRDVVGTSEAGRGSTELNTQSYVGELSYAFMANEDKTMVRPYAAVRYTRIKQDGYTEQTTATVTAPLTYSALSDRSTAALVGVKLNHKLAEKVNLTGSLGIEQDLHHHVDNLTATGVSGLTSENFNNNIKRTRPVASIGAYYMPAKNQRIAADIYYQQLPFQSTASTTAYVNYTIGF